MISVALFLFVGREYNYLTDGGRAKYLSNIESCMYECEVMKRRGVQLHGIIVTHPDSDHMNGVIKLIEKYGRTILNDYDVIITEAFFWRSRDEMCTKFLKLLDRVHSTRYPIETASTCLTPGLRCYFPSEPGCIAIRSSPQRKI